MDKPEQLELVDHPEQLVPLEGMDPLDYPEHKETQEPQVQLDDLVQGENLANEVLVHLALQDNLVHQEGMVRKEQLEPLDHEVLQVALDFQALKEQLGNKAQQEEDHLAQLDPLVLLAVMDLQDLLDHEVFLALEAVAALVVQLRMNANKGMDSVHSTALTLMTVTIVAALRGIK